MKSSWYNSSIMYLIFDGSAGLVQAAGLYWRLHVKKVVNDHKNKQVKLIYNWCQSQNLISFNDIHEYS